MHGWERNREAGRGGKMKREPGSKGGDEYEPGRDEINRREEL